MRVAVVFRDVPREWGGEASFAASLLRTLREAESETGHELVYYATGPNLGSDVEVIPAETGAKARRRVMDLRRAASDRFGSPRGSGQTWFERSVQEREIDFVWFATYYAEECQVPYIFTVFDLEYMRQPWFPEVSAGGEWERRHHYFSRYIPKATRVIVPNDAGTEQLLHAFHIHPSRVLPLHHPTTSFALAAADQDPAPRSAIERHRLAERYLLYPGHLWAHKNHLTLLRGLAELKGTAEEDVVLAIVGSDSGSGQRAHLQGLARELGVADRVRFLDFVETEELIALYQHAFALAYMSLFGPENLPPLEAMALGCPVIVADVPGAAEQFGDAAVRVPPTDPVAVAEAIRSLSDGTTRDRLTEAGRTLALSRTPEAYAEGVLGFLDEFEQTRRMWP